MAGKYDNVVYRNRGQEMVRVGDAKAPPWKDDNGVEHSAEERFNFVIVCGYGDWSPFLSAKECLRRCQIELKAHPREDGFFEIVERL